jgi:uncharacterized protein with NRDE domain
VCTVVVRWSQEEPVRILALRDELTTRDFDDPAEWWPQQPDVVGGRDRTAGGTWCASRVSTGVTALVLNRPQKRVAGPGAPSRGILPLLAVAHENKWPAHVDITGMASFALVLVAPDIATMWEFDGAKLTATDLEPATHMVTSGGVEDGKADRYLHDFETTEDVAQWRALIRRDAPSADLTELVVRRDLNGAVYATVFGQLIESAPGKLQLQYSRTPWKDDGWATLTRSP